MVREINGANGPHTGASSASKSTKGKAASAAQTGVQQNPQPSASTDSARDTVEISAQARILKNVESQLRELSDIDFILVEELRNAIAEGRYDIDTQTIADRMLQADEDFDTDPGT